MSEDGSNVEVEVQLYGPATQLSCVLDEGMAFTCKQKSRVYNNIITLVRIPC